MHRDGHGRKVNYLRLSITDRCNLRCLYCRPESEWTFIPHRQILSYEELFELVAVGRLAGVEKVRLTGGEPFARKGFLEFATRMHQQYPDLDLRITTNATLFAGKASQLRDIGVRALNISLDTLCPEKFREITGEDVWHAVYAAIFECLEAGIRVKLNVVALRGINDDEVPAFVHFAAAHALDVRFIEFMPIGSTSRWNIENYWPAADILAAVRENASLTPVEHVSPTSGPARMFSLPGGQGRIGVISAVSDHFCATCNRFRVTSDGQLRTCLFSDREYSLRHILRTPGHSFQDLLAVFERANIEKPLGHQLLKAKGSAQVCNKVMTAIGG